MKTMFSTAPFGRKDGGLATLSSPKLGQLEDIVSAITGPDSLIASISELIAKIPPGAAGSQYQAELEACKAQVAEGGTKGVAGLQCLYSLFQKIKDESGQLPTTQPYIPTPQPAPSSFPWIPVAIAGGAALLLVFALTRK